MVGNLNGVWLLIIFMTLIYCLSNAFSIVLLGGKDLLSNGLNKFSNVISLVFNWRFILSMTLAVVSRFSFVLINATLLKIPYLAGKATTITVFITFISLGFILFTNHFFLNETLNLKQAIGALIIVTGVIVILSK